MARRGHEEVNKYRNVRTSVDGITFDSKKEAKRYLELKLLVKGKVISDLSTHPRFALKVDRVFVCTYEGDFMYVEKGETVVEDAKGYKSKSSQAYRIFLIKKKLMLACYGIEIKET